MRPLFLLIALTASMTCLAGRTIAADDALWPNFLSSPSAEVKAADLPLEWSPEKGVKWKLDLPGYGQSSPIVWGKQIYVTSISGPNKEKCIVTSFDLETGKLLWSQQTDTGMPEENTIYVSRAASSPVADANGVIAFFEGGILIAYSPDGKERWKRNLVADFGETRVKFGLSSSIAQTESSAFIWVEREKDPFVLAIDKATGKDLWKVPGFGKTTWSSPSVVNIAGRSQLVLSAQTLLVGLDAKTGESLWKLEGLFGNTTPSPRPLGEGKLLLGASVGREQGGGGNAAQSNAVVEIKSKTDGKYGVDFVWKSEKATCSFNSPLAHQGCTYHLNAQGVMYCLDIATGKQHYAERIGESAWATPIGVEDRVYVFGKSGSYTVLKAGPAFEVLSQGRTWADKEPETSSDKGSTNLPGGAGGGGPGMNASATQYAAVIVPGKILIRRGGALYCIAK